MDLPFLARRLDIHSLRILRKAGRQEEFRKVIHMGFNYILSLVTLNLFPLNFRSLQRLSCPSQEMTLILAESNYVIHNQKTAWK